MKLLKVSVVLAATFHLVIAADVITITNESQFNQAVLNAQKPAVVKVGAEWCPACVRAQNPFHELAGQYPDVIFATVDSDQNSGLVRKYNVQSLPTFLFFNNGKLEKSENGFSKKNIIQTIEGFKKKVVEAPAAKAVAPQAEQEAGEAPQEMPAIEEEVIEIESPRTPHEMMPSVQEEMELGQPIAQEPEVASQPSIPETVSGPACPAQEQSFFARALQATKDFFMSIGDTIKSWFR